MTYPDQNKGQIPSEKDNSFWLRKFTLDDAQFVIQIVNDPDWLKYIGNRDVSNLEQAEAFIQQGPLQSYKMNGFGMYVFGVGTQSAGMVGLLKRDYLSKPDLGYAILPEYRGKGLTLKACQAILDLEYERAGIDGVYAIVSPDNVASLGVLHKLGFDDKKVIKHEGDRLRLLELAPAH